MDVSLATVLVHRGVVEDAISVADSLCMHFVDSLCDTGRTTVIASMNRPMDTVFVRLLVRSLDFGCHVLPITGAVVAFENKNFQLMRIDTLKSINQVNVIDLVAA